MTAGVLHVREAFRPACHIDEGNPIEGGHLNGCVDKYGGLYESRGVFVEQTSKRCNLRKLDREVL